MGLGGDLLWTPVLRMLSEKHQQNVLLFDSPSLSDLLLGKLYNRSSIRHASPVFRNNPFVYIPETVSKGQIARGVDRFWSGLTECNRSQLWMQTLYSRVARSSGFRRVYMDLPMHSYVQRIAHDRYHWKSGGHIIDIIGASVGLSDVPHQCELFFTPEESTQVDKFLENQSLNIPFLVIEPNTNTDYFGELRAWPFERWQDVVNALRSQYPGVDIVQVGVKGSRVLDGVRDTCGQLSFRETALLIQKARLFLGTEGGLMHVANAARTPGVIVWSGLTDPNFAGYPQKDRIVHIGAECAPCGLLGQCPNGRKCMQGISVKMVVEQVKQMLGV